MGGPRHSAIDTHARTRALLCLASHDGLAAALTGEGYEVVATAEIADVTRNVATNEAAVLVLDDTVRGWLRAVADLRRNRSELSVVLLGSIDNADEFLAAVAAGVDGFCPADASHDAVLRTIRSVESSGVSIPRAMVQPLVEHVRHGRGRTVHTAAGAIDVTDREWEILQMLLQRRSTREMSQQLFVSVGTVRSHVSTLLKKMGAVDREDAIRLIERGQAT